MKLMVVFLTISVDCLAQIIPIGQARTLKTGTVVTIAGRITASKEFGDLSFLQDATGGIPVYNEGLVTSVVRGDCIVVTGKLTKFNAMLEILPDSVRKIATPARYVMPKIIEPRRAIHHEGQLVTITRVVLQPSGHFFYPQRAGLVLKQGDTLNYWIDGDTDLPGYSIPSVPVSITGVVGRFRDQIQILPRAAEDIPGLVRMPVTRNDHTLTIMNWNVEFFGASRDDYGSEYGPPDEAKQVNNVARLLNTLQPDIVALQEVSDDDAFKYLLNKIPGYEGRCSSRHSYSHDTSEDFPPQKICYVYKTGVVHVVRERILFRKLYDDALSSQTSLLNDAPAGASGVFSTGRLPYLLEVDAAIDGFHERIILVNLHGKSGASGDDHARRVFDSRLLKDTLDLQYAGKKLMLLGDLNDDLDVSIAEGHQSPYTAFVNDAEYLCISKSLSDDNWHSTISYDDVIDHQVITSAMSEHYIPGSTRIVNPFGLIEDYGETTSDHLPVISEFDLRQAVAATIDQNNVRVFPNPASTSANITCPGQFQYQLINTTGTVIKKGSGFNEMSFSTSPGFYIVTVTDNTGTQTFRLTVL